MSSKAAAAGAADMPGPAEGSAETGGSTDPSSRYATAPTASSAAAAADDSVPASDAAGDAAWLTTQSDHLANVHTFAGGIAFGEVDNHGYSKLLVCDLGHGGPGAVRTLKVWSGAGLNQEMPLAEPPSAMQTFHMAIENNSPAVAVAAGSSLYVYRNFKPYYRFRLPEQDADPAERDIWQEAQAAQPAPVADTVAGRLQQLRQAGVVLSQQSTQLLSLAGDEQQTFLETARTQTPTRRTVITALGAMFKSISEPGSPSCLVVCTEACQILILSPANFSVLAKFNLSSPVAFLSVSGAFDLEYRIVVACRDAKVYGFKNGKNSGLKIELPAQAVGVVRANKTLIIGCMDNTLSCYSTKGKRLWSLTMPSPITVISSLTYRPRNLKAVMVALRSGEVRFYQDRVLVSTVNVGEPVVAMDFGRYGKADGFLALASERGGLFFKSLRRDVTFEGRRITPGPPAEQHIRINVPSKTQLYLDQTQRERQHYVQMHRTFQRDLQLLRLTTGRAYVRALKRHVPVVTSARISVKISAEVHGIGPTFKLVVQFQNTGRAPIAGLLVNLSWNAAMYEVERPVFHTGVLVTGMAYQYATFVRCLTEEPLSSPISVFASDASSSNPIPVITAVVSMPIAEPLLTVR